MVSATRLCHSYNDSVAQTKSHHVLTLSKAATAEKEQDIEAKITMWDNIKE